MSEEIDCAECETVGGAFKAHNTLGLKYHYKTQHPTIPWNPKQYKTYKQYNEGVPMRTSYYREEVARQLGSHVSNVPRQCTHVHSITGQQCGNELISAANNRVVRCYLHPIKGIDFAKTQTYAEMNAQYNNGMHVEVRPSAQPWIGGVDPGNGVFTTGLSDFQTGDYVTFYSGVHYSQTAWNTTLRTKSKVEAISLCSYVIWTGYKDKEYLDGIRTAEVGKGLASIVNRVNRGQKKNCDLVVRGEDVYLVACENIPINSELLAPYGKGYRFK